MLSKRLFTYEGIRRKLVGGSNDQLLNVDDEIKELIKIGELRIIELDSSSTDEEISRQFPKRLYQDMKKNPGEVDVYDVALSLRPNSYLSGYGLFSMLGWTEYIPKTVCVDYHRLDREYMQGGRKIDDEALQKYAFKKKDMTKSRAYYKDYEIFIRSGQFTLEHHFQKVNDLPLPPYTKIFIPERLIIDALINHHYYGGPDIVWSAGLSRLRQLDQDLFLQVHDEMMLNYPYANAIGYWLEMSSVNQRVLEQWRKRVNRELQFHLFMGDSERRVWCENWNLYVPKRFYPSQRN